LVATPSGDDTECDTVEEVDDTARGLEEGPHGGIGPRITTRVLDRPAANE
jgi:hypothetical protein